MNVVREVPKTALEDVHECVGTYVCIDTHVHTQVSTCTRMSVCLLTNVCICMDMHLCVHTCVHIWAPGCGYYMHVYPYGYMCTHIHLHMYICVCMCMCTPIMMFPLVPQEKVSFCTDLGSLGGTEKDDTQKLGIVFT